MVLDRLTLEGFRLHRRTDVAFGEGVTAIVGANGSGKSTLLEAVTFALFGEQRGTKETLRGDDGAPYRVRLEFRLGDVPYAVERRPATAFLAQGEKRLAEGLADTTRACVRLLGLGYEQFRNSFLAEQKGLAFLRFPSGAARQREVARMLGLDRLQRAEALAADARKAAAAETRALAETVGDEAAVRAAAREAEIEAKEAAMRVRSALTKERQAQKDAAGAEPAGRAAEAYLALSSRASAANEAVLQMDRASQARGQEAVAAEVQCEEAFDLAPDAARHASLLAERPAAERSTRARGEADRLDPGGTSTAPEAKAALDAARGKWSVRRDAALAERAAAREAARSAETALAEAGQGEEGAPCPVCGRPLGPEAGALRAELAQRLAGAKARLVRADEAAREPEPPVLAELADRARAAELRESAHGAPDLATLDAEIAALAPAAARAKALAGSGRRFEEAEARHRESLAAFRQAEATAARIAEELADTGIADNATAQSALARAASARAAATAAGVALKTAEANERSAERARDAAEARLQEARERRETLKRAKHEEALQGAVATEMRALRTALNGALRPDLEARAGELLERMTAGRYRRVRLDADFEPTVVDDETDRAVLSGGEEDVTALALRLALAELVQDRGGHALTLLMLDEAFGALDAERRQSLLDVLAGLRERYVQVLVVTHIEDVAQIADHVLRVARDATGAARVTDG